MSTGLRKLCRILLGAVICFFPVTLFAHCDSLGGPVIKDATHALETGTLTPVLKWIKKEYEAEISQTFSDVMEVRALNSKAKELADRSFLEAVVRLHRAGEGSPFTGLKAEPLEPAITEADQALRTGSMDSLSRMVTATVQKQLQDRFQAAVQKKKESDLDVEKGREYVEAYIQFVHYVERLQETPEH